MTACLALALTLAVVVAQEPPSEPTRASRLAALRESLTARLHRDLAGDLGPRVAAGLQAVLERPSVGNQKAYHPTERGWVSADVAATFLRMNPQWTEDAPFEPLDTSRARAAIVDLHRQLAGAGVELLVVPIPTRVQVAPDVLPGIEAGEVPGGFAPGLTRFLLDLVDEGVEVVDLLPALAAAQSDTARGPGQVYLRCNSHWGPDGLQIGAEVLAATLSSRDWFPARGATTSVLQRLEVAASQPVGALPEERVQVDRVLGPDGKSLRARDKQSPVLLLGDSFATWFEDRSADFSRHLHHRMGFAADVIAMQAGGHATARKALARRKQPLEGKRVVVWMFSAYALLEDGWEPIPVVRGYDRRRMDLEGEAGAGGER